MNDRDYDAWKLDTPPHYDNDIEVYEADMSTYYHYDEKVLSDFEKKVEDLAQELGLFLNEDDAYENAEERKRL